MTRLRRSSRYGYTLVEFTLVASVAAVLMGGLASAISLSARALPDDDSPAGAAMAGYHATEQIVSELLCSRTFTQRSSTLVEFTVADRTGDGSPETIRYQWSGTPGDPITRQYNGATAADFAFNVHEFDLGYVVAMQTGGTQPGTTWGEGELLTLFDGWAAITPTAQNHIVNEIYWVSQYFELTPPGGVTELKITLARVMLSHAGMEPDSITVAIHRSKGDGSYVPDVTPIGTPATIPGASLTTMSLWTNAEFSDVVVSDVARNDYCLVVKGVGTTPGYVQYYYSKDGPANGTYNRWTADGGGSWDPPDNDLDEQDVRFMLYGMWGTSGGEVTADQYFVTEVQVALRITEVDSARVNTSVQILNAPEVASP